jgi:hypothetical protein
MTCKSMHRVCLGAIALCLYAHVAAGQPSTAILNYIPRAAELDGRPPELFTHFRSNLFAVVDPSDNRVVIIARNGTIAGASTPLPFVPDKVTTTEAAIEFIQQDTGRRAILPRSADPAQLGTLSILAAAVTPASAPTAVSRLASQTIKMQIGERTRRQLVVRSRSRGYLSNVQLIGRDDSGRYYVQSTEVVDTAPRIRVRVFVQRFSNSTALLDFAEVPVANMDSVPGSMVALSPSGDVNAIVPTETGLFLQPLKFEGAGDATKRVLVPASAPVRTRIDATIADLGPREATPDEIEPAAVLPPTTREQILDRANGYLVANWTMRPENFSRSSIENRCAKTAGKYWSRPRRFTEGEIGKTFGPVPYDWGGADTPQGFLARLADGALAGNVCTCREAQYNQCQVNEAAGVDCSGFVSRAWGIAKRGTSGLAQVATPVRKLQDLRPGDAFNRAGSHVRLLVGVRPGPQLLFDVLESATNLRCEGVCKSTYTAAQLEGYQPLRFSGVSN